MAEELTDEELAKLIEGAIKESDKEKSSGGSAPLSSRQKAKAQYEQNLISTYLSLWGVAPPPGYIEGVMGRGMNIFEFEANERAKPSFRYSGRYNEERLSAGLGLAQRFGALG